ncbi:MAG: transcriptional repressor [Defluviitaleaceae bacterium]|nr:transcriptional repressor [Defluviitaleaceae bacterium]
MTRNTVQRQIILDTLRATKTHPTAEGLYKEIQKNYPSIGMATVYRNLRQLVEQGTISQIATLDGVARYDGYVEPHYHFHCNNCEGTFDLEIELFDNIEGTIESKYGFRVDSHDVTFSGVCSQCLTEYSHFC